MRRRTLPLHAAVLEDIFLCGLRLEDNIEGERFQGSLGLVNLNGSLNMKKRKIFFFHFYPNLPLPGELNDALVMSPLLLLTDRSDSDDHVDVVSVALRAGVAILRLEGPVHGLAKGGRASGADNEETN